MNYKKQYLKYKRKYINLKYRMIGGVDHSEECYGDPSWKSSTLGCRTEDGYYCTTDSNGNGICKAEENN